MTKTSHHGCSFLRSPDYSTIAEMIPLHSLLLYCALALTGQVAQAGAQFNLLEVARGIFVHRGAQEDAAASNAGDIANVGFIVGEKCVAVIDTGGSLLKGQELQAAIRSKTETPVCYIINTHVHPDHIFGNAAFRDAVFVGHARLPAAMAARGRTYLNAWRRDLGDAAAGSEIVPPTRLVEATLDLDLGGRMLKLKAWATAHTDHDLTVYDEATRTLWLSDLLFVERTPVVDGSIKGWLEVIEQIKDIPAKIVVPGHGWIEGDWRDALARERQYLRTLVEQTRAAIKRGETIQQAVKNVGWAERGRWLLFDSYHPRNVTAVYAELEWDD
jgi:quinoprotein relay system zinc metallohydrolase 2